MLGGRSRRGGRVREAGRPEEFATVLCHLACDAADASRKANVRASVAGELTKASQHLPPAISNHAVFKSWKALLENEGS